MLDGREASVLVKVRRGGEQGAARFFLDGNVERDRMKGGGCLSCEMLVQKLRQVRPSGDMSPFSVCF